MALVVEKGYSAKVKKKDRRGKMGGREQCPKSGNVYKCCIPLVWLIEDFSFSYLEGVYFPFHFKKF